MTIRTATPELSLASFARCLQFACAGGEDVLYVHVEKAECVFGGLHADVPRGICVPDSTEPFQPIKTKWKLKLYFMIRICTVHQLCPAIIEIFLM